MSIRCTYCGDGPSLAKAAPAGTFRTPRILDAYVDFTAAISLYLPSGANIGFGVEEDALIVAFSFAYTCIHFLFSGVILEFEHAWALSEEDEKGIFVFASLLGVHALQHTYGDRHGIYRFQKDECCKALAPMCLTAPTASLLVQLARDLDLGTCEHSWSVDWSAPNDFYNWPKPGCPRSCLALPHLHLIRLHGAP